MSKTADKKPRSFEDIATDMVILQGLKNKDYDNAFAKSCDEFGLISPAIRLTDKLNRFKSLVGKQSLSGSVKNESIEDTLIDMAAYAIMTVEWLEGKRV